MRFFLKFVAYLSVFTCFFMATALAAESSELSGLLNGIKTMRAGFVQTIYDNNGKAIQKSTGYMALERPGKFRWEVSQPMPQVIIANRERLWIYDPDLQQVTIRSLKSDAGEAPALLLSHQNTTLESIYNIQAMNEQNDLRWFLLKPKKSDNMFASVKMGFVKTQLKEMVLEDQIGHSTRVQFQKIEMNTAISPSLFVFKAPAGTDVIDETK
jgi:outer membrane lipoprotein carrier protein